jgi:predicted DNA-binding transcriptional regulator YafY
VSRVTAVERTGQPAIRPPDFDLEATWHEVVERVDELRSPAHIVALVDPPHVDTVRWMFGHQATTEGEEVDGRIKVRIRGQHADLLATQLAGFGRRVEVVDPPEVRDQLAALGTELHALYRA